METQTRLSRHNKFISAENIITILSVLSDDTLHASLTNIYISKKKVKLATIVEGDSKAPFSIATTPRCREGRYSFPRIAPLYP